MPSLGVVSPGEVTCDVTARLVSPGEVTCDVTALLVSPCELTCDVTARLVSPGEVTCDVTTARLVSVISEPERSPRVLDDQDD